MTKPSSELEKLQQALERKQLEMVQMLQQPPGIAIERSADQMDEIQSASERDLAILNVDRETNLLGDVRAALRRMHEGDYGTCMDCDQTISPIRLLALPWALRCIHCQEIKDQQGEAATESSDRELEYAA